MKMTQNYCAAGCTRLAGTITENQQRDPVRMRTALSQLALCDDDLPYAKMTTLKQLRITSSHFSLENLVFNLIYH